MILAGTFGALVTLMRKLYVFLITTGTLLLAALALFFFVTMDSAHALNPGVELIADSSRSADHFGRGMVRTTGGQNLTFTSYERKRVLTVAQGEDVGVNFASEKMPPWLHKYVELELGTFKVLIYAHRAKIGLKQNIYKIRGADMLPPQKYDVEMEIKSETAGPNDHLSRRRRCRDGRYYFQIYERENKIQNVNLKLLDPSDNRKTIGTLSTVRTRVSREISKGSTACTTSPVDPTAPVISTGSPTVPPAAR